MYWSKFGSFDADPIFGSSFLLRRAPGMKQLQQEMNRLFEGAVGESGSTFPPVDVRADDNRALVRAEMPGLKGEDIELSVAGSTLTLKGERTSEFSNDGSRSGEGDRVVRRERGMGPFSRVIELPFPVESDSVKADYKNGVLTVTLPRAAADKPKKIVIR